MIDLILKWAVPFVCGALVGVIVSLFVKIKALGNGVQCLLRMKIIEMHDKYTEKGYCPIAIKESLSRTYKAYHNLGGNDVATGLYNETLELPTEERRTENGNL